MHVTNQTFTHVIEPINHSSKQLNDQPTNQSIGKSNNSNIHPIVQTNNQAIHQPNKQQIQSSIGRAISQTLNQYAIQLDGRSLNNINQTTKQTPYQTINRSSNQSIEQTNNKSNYQPIEPSSNRLINQYAIQTDKQSINNTNKSSKQNNK